MRDAVLVGGAMVLAGVFLIRFGRGWIPGGSPETDTHAAWLQRRGRRYRTLGVLLIAGGVVVFLRESGMLASWFGSA